MLSVNGGTGQSANPGQPLAGALVATVGDSSGNPLASQPVVWTVSPAGAATLSNTSNTSDSNGRVTTNVTLASTATGTVQVKVALANNPNVSATFNITANIQVSGLQIVSGNSQSAVVNTNFPLPLVVQLSTSNGTIRCQYRCHRSALAAPPHSAPRAPRLTALDRHRSALAPGLPLEP